MGPEFDGLRALLDPASPDGQAHDAICRAKRLATIRARCALQGIELHVLAGDDGRPEYIATKWAMTRAFDDIHELDLWLLRVEGKA